MNKFFSKCVSFVLSPLVSFLRKEIQIAVENYDAEKVVAAMWKDSFEAKVHEELAKLDLIQKVDEACDRYNFESRIEQEVDNFEIDYQVRKAFEDVDVQDIVSDAANDYDFSSLVNESVDDAVEDYVQNCIEWQDLIKGQLYEFNFTEFFENHEKITNDVVAYFKQKLDDALEDRFGHINERLGTIEMQDQAYAVEVGEKVKKWMNEIHENFVKDVANNFDYHNQKFIDKDEEIKNEIASISEQLMRLSDSMRCLRNDIDTVENDVWQNKPSEAKIEEDRINLIHSIGKILTSTVFHKK
jgi:hypothetical protein